MAVRSNEEKPARRPADVCAELDIQPYVLKFWEAEFPQLGKRIGAKRNYGPVEVEITKEIRRLIEEEGLSLQDARAALERQFPEKEPPALPFERTPAEPREPDPRDDEQARALDAAVAEKTLLEQKLTMSGKTLERARAEVERLKSELAAARDEAEAARMEIAAGREELETARGEAAASREEAESARREADEREASCAEGGPELGEAQRRLDAALADVAAARGELVEAGARIHELEREVERLKPLENGRKSDAAKELAEAEARIEELDLALARAREEQADAVAGLRAEVET
ncbi:MAG: MerR family transcriptional regulator, partial [Candidatus Polarisedimenticolia bacterium]